MVSVKKHGGCGVRRQLTARDVLDIEASKRVANVPQDFYDHANSLRGSRAPVSRHVRANRVAAMHLARIRSHAARLLAWKIIQ